jgi:hypothetical protein
MTEPVVPSADSVAGALSELWRAALGRPPASPDTDFFAAGGDSVLIVRMVSQLRKAGLAAGPADFLRGRTFGGVVDRLRASNPDIDPVRPAAPAGAGPVPLLPTQARWVANRFPDPDHFGLVWVFHIPENTPDGKPVDADRLESAVYALAERHEALRTRYQLDATGGAVAEVLGKAPDGLVESVSTDDDGVPAVLRQGLAGHRLADGRVFTASWLPRQRLLQVAVHHLTLDGYSLTVLADDLEDLLTDREISLPASQPRDYADDLSRWCASGQAAQDAARWADLGWAQVRRVPTESSGAGLLPSMASAAAELGAAPTAALLRAAGELRQPVDLLVLSAAGWVITNHFGLPAVSVDTYHHGRDGVPGGHDLTDTIGYLQSNYPVVTQAGPRRSWLARAGTDLARLPSAKYGFDALRFAGHAGLADLNGSGIRLNFRSRMNQMNDRDGQWLRPAEVSGGGRRSSRQHEPYLLMLEGDLVADRLVFTVKYSRDHFTDQTVRALVAATVELLAETDPPGGTVGREARP